MKVATVFKYATGTLKTYLKINDKRTRPLIL